MERERLLVWGGGGHGRVVADLVEAAGHKLLGFADRDIAKVSPRIDHDGPWILTSDDELTKRLEANAPLPGEASGVVPAVGSNADRLTITRLLGGMLAPALVHPKATVSPSASLGAGTVVFAGAVVNAGARIGRGVIVNTAAIVEHDCTIGDGAHLSPGAVLAGGARIGTRAWIGANAVVIENRVVGNDVVIGAGAVLIRDATDGSTYVGNPARSLG